MCAVLQSEVAEIKRKISREVNMRKELDEGSLKGSNVEVRYACYAQLAT